MPNVSSKAFHIIETLFLKDPLWDTPDIENENLQKRSPVAQVSGLYGILLMQKGMSFGTQISGSDARGAVFKAALYEMCENFSQKSPLGNHVACAEPFQNQALNEQGASVNRKRDLIH